MAKREKKPVLVNISEGAMNEALSEYATADARIAKINAELDVQFTKLRDKVAYELEELDARKSKAWDVVEAYALENRESLFAKKKSIELPHGCIGFRTGTPRLKTLKGFTWGAVTNLLKEFLPGHVRTVVEPAKDKLLADRADEQVFTHFRRCGIEVVQDEAFYIDLKKEDNEQ
jgi:hypothetical protein